VSGRLKPRVVAGRGRVGVVLAGQDAHAERAPGEQREVERPGHGRELTLDGALDQAVLSLGGHERCPPVPGGDRVGVGDDPRGRVADPEVEHLAGSDLVVERAHDLLDRCEEVPDVHPEHVDVVGAQALQARVERVHEALAVVAGAVGIGWVARERVLRGQHPAVAFGRDDFADVALRGAARVVVGGVDEVAARLGEGVDDAPALLPGPAPAPLLAEGHGSQAQLGDP
jgi:hypothetical protein